MLSITKARKVPIDSSNTDYFTVIIETDDPSFAFISKRLLTVFKLQNLCSEVSREEENVSAGFLFRNPLKLYRCLRNNGCLIRISKENSVNQVISRLKPEMDKEVAESKRNQPPKDTRERASKEWVHDLVEKTRQSWYEKAKEKRNNPIV